MPSSNWKRQYFQRALRKKYPRRPPRRLGRHLYPALIENRYARELDAIVKFVKARIDLRILPLLPELKRHYDRDRVDAADDSSERKYYTAFIYADTKNANVLHCTHKYLGRLTDEEALDVEKRVDKFYASPRVLPRTDFSKEAFLGPEENIRVLEADDPGAFLAFSPLQRSLDEVREDDYDGYRPHVTPGGKFEGVKRIEGAFSHYALISKDGIHRTWPKTVRADDYGDADLGDLADELESIRIDVAQKYSEAELEKLARLTGRTVEQWNEAQMNGQLQGIVEIDLFGSEPWLAREMGAYVVQNVSAIQSIPEEYLGQVEKIIANATRSGLRVEDLASDLEDRYDVSRSRAEFIARDQVGKFNGQVTELRQKDLGIDQYTWRTSGDARVRDTHRENALRDSGSGPGVYEWADPPETGHPGEDYQCRCSAEPVLAKFYEDDA